MIKAFWKNKAFEYSTQRNNLNDQLAERDKEITKLTEILIQEQLEGERKDKEIERLKDAMNIQIGDFIMIDDEPQFVSAIVSDPVLRVYYWLDNEELSVTIDEIDCHFVNMNRVKEDLDQ